MDDKRPAMTISDVASILQVSEKTITRMLQSGSIPAFKVANQWRFHPEDFDRWLERKRTGGERLDRDAGLGPLPLSRMTGEDLIAPNLQANSKEGVFRLMVGLLVKKGVVADAENFVTGLLDREKMMSTGVGGGIAIPHLRHPADLPVDRPLAVIGISREGVDWGSIDGDPVKVVILPVTGNERLHLRTLSVIRYTAADDNFVGRLTDSESAEEVISQLIRYETVMPFADVDS